MLAQGGDVGPVETSLSFGLLSSLIALIVIFLWLEWGPQRGAAWVWSPLALPALPLVTGQYFIALRLGLDGRYAAVLWSHLLWVLPWMLLVLQPAWRRIDPRLILTARTLGWRRAKIFLLLKCPLLVRPALLAFAIGFSVSMAQYMPTLWLGAGRFATLTTETVALSSGGASLFSRTGRWDYCWSRGTCSVLPPCYPGSWAATVKDYVNAEGKKISPSNRFSARSVFAFPAGRSLP